VAIRESLAVVNAEISGDEDDAWARSHAAHERLLATEDFREGIDAFFGRRPPTFRGC